MLSWLYIWIIFSYTVGFARNISSIFNLFSASFETNRCMYHQNTFRYVRENIVSEFGCRKERDLRQLGKVKVVRNWPNQRTVRDIRSFVWLMQFFVRFIRDLLTMATLPTSIIRESSRIQNLGKSCDDDFASTVVQSRTETSWGGRKPFRISKYVL